MPAAPTPRRTPKRARATILSPLPNSSDTECSPPKKRQRREERPRKRRECDLVELLCLHLSSPSDYSVITDLTTLGCKDQDIVPETQGLIDHVKASVKEEMDREGTKVLEVELYLRWLEGFVFVFTAIESILSAKVPRTRQRVRGLGRLSFATLYHLLESFLDEVSAHQDGWSSRHPVGPIEIDPLVMTLAEESNDSSTDDRSEEAVYAAEELFARFDKILFEAVRRYKSECYKELKASNIGRKEESLTNRCCLLSEQTGFGATDDMRFNLLVESREAMVKWKNEFLTSRK